MRDRGTLRETPLEWPDPVDPDSTSPAPFDFDLSDWLGDLSDTLQTANVVAVDGGLTVASSIILAGSLVARFRVTPAGAQPGQRLRMRLDFTTAGGYTGSVTGILRMRET